MRWTLLVAIIMTAIAGLGILGIVQNGLGGWWIIGSLAVYGVFMAITLLFLRSYVHDHNKRLRDIWPWRK